MYAKKSTSGSEATPDAITTNAASLPPELDQAIAESLHDDPVTLRAFILTSRSWNLAGRPVLFRKVHLRYPSHQKKLQEILESSPYIGNYIKHMRISKYIGILPESFTKHLYNVRDLELYGSDVGRWDTSHQDGLARMPAIQRLCFHRYLLRPSHIAQMISLFPMLEQVEAIMCYAVLTPPQNGEELLPPCPAISRLSHVRLMGGNFPSLCSRLLEWLGELETIRTLSMQLALGVIPHLPEFLRNCGTSFEILELSFMEPWSDHEKTYSDLVSTLDFPSNSSLNTLYFYNKFHHSLYTLLEKLPPGQIGTLGFQLSEDFKWEELDHSRIISVLSSFRFSGLQKLLFLHKTPFPWNPASIEPTPEPGSSSMSGDHDAERSFPQGMGTVETDKAKLDPYALVETKFNVEHKRDSTGFPGAKWLWTTDVDVGQVLEEEGNIWGPFWD